MNPLPVPVDVAIMVVSAILGIVYGRRLYERGARLGSKTDARQAVFLSILGLIFVFGNTGLLLVKNYPTVSWHLPVVVQYYCIPVSWSLNVAMVAFLFFAVGSLAWEQGHRARWVVLIAAVAALVVGEYTIQNSLYFRPPELGEPKVDKDGVVLQSCGATCAAASCANIARKYGIDATETSMVEVLGTSLDGTTPSQVVYGMTRLGFTCRKRRIADADFTKLAGPAVLMVTYGSEPLGHAVAYMGSNGDKAEVWNPQGGRQLMSQEQLGNLWQGHAIEVFKRE